MNTPLLLSLVARLRACPSRDPRITEQKLLETWGGLRRLAPEHGDPVTPAVLAGVILYDPDTFAPLLNAAEHAQLVALGRTALERYLQRIHPPIHLGQLLAATLKETL